MIYAFFSLVSSICCLALAVTIFCKNSNNPLNRIYSLLCFSFSVWGIFEFLSRQAESPERAKLWLDLCIFWPFTIALFFHFALLLAKTDKRRFHPLYPGLTYIAACVGSILELLTIRREPVIHQSWGWTNNISSNVTLHSVIVSWGGITALASIYLLLKYCCKMHDEDRGKQLRYLLTAVFTTVIAGISSQWILPLLNIKVPELTVSTFGITSVLVAYAVWRHRLFALSPAMAGETIISTLSDALAVVNNEWKIEIVNNSLVRMLGYSEQELLYKDWNIIAEESASPGYKQIAEMVQEVSIGEMETTFRKRNGSSIPVSLSWSVLKDAKDKTRGVIFIGRDISELKRSHESLERLRNELEKMVDERTKELVATNEHLKVEISERKAVEKQLADEKERLAVTLRSIADGVITTDIDGRIIMLNKSAEKMTMWTNDEAEGRFIDEIYKILKRNVSDENHTLDSILKNPAVLLRGCRSELLTKTGDRLRISECGSPIFDNKGNILGVVLVFRDMTEQENMEEELFKTRKFESVSLLAGGIAHDFNNLLTGIVTNLFMAKMSLNSESDIYHLVNSAEKAAFRASNLTNQLLSYSKGGSPIKENASIKDLIEDSVGFYLSGSKADYRLLLPDDLYNVAIDRGQIDQVINNIIINADQSMPEGGIITVGAENFIIENDRFLPLPPGKYVRISISDSGTGIPPEHLNRIFDPYFTTRENGNGLGLASAFAIIKKHGGHITVTSEIGAGSTFILYLPAMEKPAPEENDHSSSEAVIGRGKILIMDDEEFILRSSKKVFMHLGYQVTTAEHGAEALDLVRASVRDGEPFDAAIFDLTVPGGLGAKDIIKEVLAADPDLKVIVASGYANDPAITGFSDYGFYAAISKPFNIEEISNLLQRVTSK